MSVITTVNNVCPLIKERTLKERDSLDEVVESFAIQLKNSPSTVISVYNSSSCISAYCTKHNVELMAPKGLTSKLKACALGNTYTY